MNTIDIGDSYENRKCRINLFHVRTSLGKN